MLSALVPSPESSLEKSSTSHSILTDSFDQSTPSSFTIFKSTPAESRGRMEETKKPHVPRLLSNSNGYLNSQVL